MALILIIALVVLLDLAALRSAADTRPTILEDPSGFLKDVRHAA